MSENRGRPEDNFQILTQDDFEQIHARLSLHEFLIEILLANLWNSLGMKVAQDVKQNILELIKTSQRGHPADEAGKRIAHLLEAQAKNLLDKVEGRLRSGQNS